VSRRTECHGNQYACRMRFWHEAERSCNGADRSSVRSRAKIWKPTKTIAWQKPLRKLVPVSREWATSSWNVCLSLDFHPKNPRDGYRRQARVVRDDTREVLALSDSAQLCARKSQKAKRSLCNALPRVFVRELRTPRYEQAFPAKRMNKWLRRADVANR